MDKKKNQIFTRVLVWVMVIGLVGSFAPLIFTRPQITDNEAGLDSSLPPQTASLTPPTKPTSTIKASGGFTGLEDENKKLNDFDKSLGN